MNLSIIYEPKGAAKEYADLACNLFVGCVHSCQYCYCPGAMHKTREEFHQGPKLKENAITRLHDDCETMYSEGSADTVLFSFATDPFQNEMTLFTHLLAIETLSTWGIHATFLTKAGLMALPALREMRARPDLFSFGQTVVFSIMNDVKRMAWEPRSSSIHERLRAFQLAKEYGIRTWLSLEPVVDPEDALLVIREFSPWVDEFKVGKWNHDKRAGAIDWGKFCAKATILLDDLGCKYTFKSSLQPYLPGSTEKHDNTEVRV